MSRVEIVSGVERRRRWSDEAKLQILAEADRPGARIGEVARRHDIFPAQIRTWRRKFSAPDQLTTFVPVKVLERECAQLQVGARASSSSVTRSSTIKISPPRDRPEEEGCGLRANLSRQGRHDLSKVRERGDLVGLFGYLGVAGRDRELQLRHFFLQPEVQG